MNATACYFENAMAQESTEIARGLRRRDPDLLDRLIEKYQHRLLRYLMYLTGRRELAEDLFQETWIRVLERGRQYDGRHEFSTWLFTIARNLVIDYLRRKQPASLDGLADADDAAPFDIPAFADDETKLFYGLAILGTIREGTEGFGRQEQAGQALRGGLRPQSGPSRRAALSDPCL